SLGLSAELFPAVLPSGTPLGGVRAGLPGLAEGTPVAVAGHDHVAASFAVGAAQPGQAFDSMGTAEAFMGTRSEQPLGEAEYRSGLAYGCYVRPGRQYWSGGVSASGGSVEWLRGVLREPPVPYASLEALLEQAGDAPGNLLFFPYLAGSGSPHTDPTARGAFVGLRSTHGPAHLVKAVLEGVAYEVEFIRRTAELANRINIRQVIAAGGGTRNRRWMQIKADVCGCTYAVSVIDEATLLGAALLAGLGSRVYASEAEALQAAAQTPAQTYSPDPARRAVYRELYEQGYLAMQDSLRQVSYVLGEAT
ncbi:MAG TPA: FGGY-family carbohydrate kinase, partial [Anaerolineales bacterium]